MLLPPRDNWQPSTAQLITMTRRELLVEVHGPLVFADGLDDAIIGIGYRYGSLPHVVYSLERCVEITMKDMDDKEEAIEYIMYNFANAYVGEQTPLLVTVEGMGIDKE